MGNPVVSAEFKRVFDENLREVAENRFKELPTMIPELFSVLDTEKAWEEFWSVSGLPDIPSFNGKLEYLPVYPGYYTRIEPKEYAAGVQFERKLMDDKRWPIFDNTAMSLMESAQRTQEKIGVEPFAYATSAAFTFQTTEEGLSLANNSHTTKSGTSTSTGFDNLGTSALSKTSVAATRIAMRQFRSDISERISISDNLAIIVPDALDDTAREIVDTPKSLDTAEGNVNPQYKRYKVIPHMRLDDYDANNWMMVDMDAMRRSLFWLNRITPDKGQTIDFETFFIKYSIYFRVAYGFTDWRWIYYNNVS